jgi:hypothetical protein
VVEPNWHGGTGMGFTSADDVDHGPRLRSEPTRRLRAFVCMALTSLLLGSVSIPAGAAPEPAEPDGSSPEDVATSDPDDDGTAGDLDDPDPGEEVELPDPEPTEEVDETVVDKARIEDLIASWWSGPRAVHDASSGITLSTGVSADGTFTLTRHDRVRGEVVRVPLGREEPDDHNTPAVLTGPDLPTMVFYARHGKDRFLRMRIADAPWSISFGAERQVELPGTVTYVQAFRGPHRGSVRVLSRVGGSWWLGVSPDAGETWNHRQLFRFPSGQRGYVVLRQRSDGSVTFAAAGHPTLSDLRAVWAGTLGLDGLLRDHDGRILGDVSSGQGLPVDVPAAMTPIYSVPSGQSLRLFDVGARSGRFEVAIADWSLDDHVATYRVVDTLGGGIDLGPAGQVLGYDPAIHYHGGVAFGDREDGIELFLARERDGTWTVERWFESLGGQTDGETLAAGSNALLRPITASGASGDVILWHEALHYGATYTDYVADKLLVTVASLREPVPAYVPALSAIPAQPEQPPPGPKEIAVAGDWNGDGTSTPGWFADGIWHLLLDARTGATTTFRFGATGDVPVTGDWNGDGRTTVGVRREGDWLLRNGNSRGPVSYSFLFGRPSDVPVTGDWNGDGRTTVGVERDREWLLRDANSRGPVTQRLSFAS